MISDVVERDEWPAVVVWELSQEQERPLKDILEFVERLKKKYLLMSLSLLRPLSSVPRL